MNNVVIIVQIYIVLKILNLIKKNIKNQKNLIIINI